MGSEREQRSEGREGTRKMAGGWTRDGAVAEQIEASISDELARMRQRMSDGESRSHCAECEEPIPAARRKAVRGVDVCIDCQRELDLLPKANVGINRRGSKDSQLAAVP